MRTLRPPTRRRGELLSWIAAAFVALPLAFLIVGGVFSARETIAAGETEVASVSARAALARAQRGDAPAGTPAARNLAAAAAAPSFFDFAAGAVYRTLCPLFQSCNIAKTPSTNHATSFEDVKLPYSSPGARDDAPAATSLAASNSFASPVAPADAMPADASYPETNSPNVKPSEFIPPSPSNDGLAARSRETSSAFPESTNPPLPRPTPQPPAVSTPSDPNSLAILGVALQKLFDQKIAALDQSLRQVIFQNASAPLSLPASGGTVNNIALSQRIDNLSGTTISNPTITGGSITAASISGTITSAIDSALATIESLTVTELVATNATSTHLTVYNPPVAPAYTATSTATSTFVGGIATARINASGTSTLAGIALTGTDCSSYGNGGKLTTDVFGNVYCSDDYGASGGGGTPGGSNTQVQFNDSGSLNGDSGFTYNKTTDRATITNASTTNVTAAYASSSQAFFGILTLPTLGSGALAVDANGTVYKGATSTLSTISGTLALGQIANIGANTILGNSTGSAGNVTAISTSSLGILTTNVAEGSNLYFTAARADARINATSSIGTLTALPNLGTVATSLTGFLRATAGVLSTALVNLASDVTGILPVASGGTGWANIAASAIPYGNGAGALATTTAGTNGYVLAYLNGVPAWTATTTFSAPLSYSGGAVSIPVANGSTNGYLSSADWTTFNGKQAAFGFTPPPNTRSIATTYPLQGGGDLSADRILSLAFGTTTSNTWAGTQTFTNTISGGITGNAGTVTNGVYTTDTGTVTNTMLAGSIANGKLANSSITVNGTGIALGSSGTITAASSTALADYNTWANAQTFSAAPILSTLSGLLKGNGASAVTAAAAGTDYAPATAGTSVLLGNGSGGFSSYAGTSCTNQFIRTTNGAGVATCASVSLTADVTGTLGYGNGGTGTTTAPSSWLLYGGGNGVYQAVSTSSIAVGSGISVTSGTLGYQVGGANVTLGIANSAISNAMLANSTIALSTGSTGSDINVSGSPASLGGTLTLNIPSASASNRGLLTSADWTTFNGKQAALVSGTNIKTVNGTTLLGSGDLGTIDIAHGGTNATSFTSSNYAIYYTGSALATAPTTAAITIPYASTTAISSTGSAYFATSGGNVGIGTTTPNNLLEIYSTSGAAAKMRVTTTDTTATYSGYGLYNGAAFAGGLFRLGSTNDLHIFTAGDSSNPRVTFQNGGNVGIGTTSPFRLLSVAGDVVATRVSAYGSGLIPLNTAIGAGSLASNTTGSRNTAIGYGALFSATSSDSNTALGYEALYNVANNVVEGHQGYRNTAVGDSALFSNTSGSYNTAIGFNAMYYNTTGTTSVAVGNQALFNNTTGWSNTAVGQNALGANTTGYFNTGLGNAAGESLTTAIRNVAVGQGALRTATSSSNNVAVGQSSLMYMQDVAATGPNTALGSSALMYTTFGGSNVAVGANAGYTNTTGSYNSLLGLGALEGASTASENVALGYRALSIATGNNNIAIGSQTGDALTSGANNILIGYNIDAPVASGNNQLSIGNLIFGTGVDGSNTTLSSGNIGIGTTSPNATLAVSGNGYLTTRLGIGTNINNGAGSVSAAGASAAFFAYDQAGMSNGYAALFRNGLANYIYDSGGGYLMTLLPSGNVGIGTTNPNDGKLEVKGGTVCVDTDSNGSATSCIANESDERLKTNIQAISASGSLDTILALRPVSFDWRAADPEVLKHYPLLARFASSTHSIGLIAQQVQPFVPEAISPETVGDSEVQYFQLDYFKFIPHLIGAIQQLAHKLEDLATTVASFADHFTTRELTFTRAEGDEIHVEKLCVGAVCVSEADFLRVFGASVTSQTTAASASSQSAGPVPSPATPPIIEIQGNNPAHLNIGDSYNDLGARITGPTQADTNLGIKTFLNGALVSNIVLDTTTPATNTIDYVATNAAGTATSTRTVIIDAPDQPAPARDAPPLSREPENGEPAPAPQ